ncbi:MAG: hypothetical protein JXB05_30505 [Myxococcaceae bacterium]|nr:hypothetical protein [Myxococcaceae bacterium]
MKTIRRALGLGLLALWTGCADFEQAEQAFCERNPDRCADESVLSGLTFTTAPQQVQVGACSSVATVQLRNARGGPVQATADTVVELSAAPPEGFQFFADAACAGAAVTAVTIPTSSSNASFYFRGSRVGTTTLSASTGGLSGNQEVNLTPIPPSVLAVALPASPVSAGTCVSGSVQVKGENGSATIVSRATPVGLAGDPTSSVDLYSDASCTTRASSVILAAQAGEAAFYFLGRATGRVTISASAEGLAPASQSVEISPGTGPRLVFVSPPQVAEAGACSSAVLVQSQDAQGNPVQTSAATSITLAATPSAGFGFYSDAACSALVTSANLAVGTTNASFYFRGTKAGNVTVTVTATGYTGSSQAETINPGPPTLIALAGPQTVPAGDCSAQASVELRDTHGNPTQAPANRAITLSAGGVSLRFFTDSQCGTAASSVTVPAGSSSAPFSFRGVQAGNSTLTGASTGLASGTLSVAISPSGASVLTFTTGAQTVAAGSCSAPVTVQVGPQGNPQAVASALAVSLAATPSTSLTFFSDPSCGTEVTQISIPASQSSASFYLRGSSAGPATVTASATGLTSASQGQTITAGAPNKLHFSSPPHTTPAGSCSPVVTLQTVDAFDNPSPVTANVAINLSPEFGSTTDGQFQFYSDAGCTTPVTQVTLPAGQTSVGFYYRGEKAQLVNLWSFASGLNNGVQQHTVTPGPAATLRFSPSTPPQLMLAGTCTLRTVESWDAFENPGANALTVTLSASASAGFYLDAACTSPMSQVSIPQGQNKANFYFKGFTGGINAVGQLNLLASSAGLTPATQTESIIPTVRTGECFMGPSSAGINCSVNPPLSEPGRAFLTFQATTKDKSSDGANVRCFLDGLSGIKCDRAGTGEPVNIRWSVAEFPPGVAIEHHDVSCQGNPTSVSLASEAKLGSSFLLLSSRRAGSMLDPGASRIVELVSPFEAWIQRTSGCTSSDLSHLQVVEYQGASVLRGRLEFMSDSTAKVDLPTQMDPNRSILLYSYMASSSNDPICARMLRGELISDGRQVLFSRGQGDFANCGFTSIEAISWEVVQFPQGTLVQQVTQPLTEISAAVTLPTPVDPSRTLVIAGGQWASGQLHGEGKYDFNDLPSDMRAQAFLSDASTVKIVRETTFAPATFTLFVIQLQP